MKKRTFEEDIERVEEIIGQLDEGDHTLEESLTLYEEGVKRIGNVEVRLEEAVLAVERISAGNEPDTAEE